MLYTLLFSASFGVTSVLFAFSSSPPYPTLYFFLYLFKLNVTSYLLFVRLFEFDTGPHTSQASLKLIHCITEDDLGFMVLLPKCRDDRSEQQRLVYVVLAVDSRHSRV